MKKNNFSKYNTGIMSIEVTGMMPEKLLNLFWKNEIEVKNIRRKNAVTIEFDIKLKDYKNSKEICYNNGYKFKIVRRKGLAFFILKARKRTALLFGVLIFAFVLYYLSTYIWGIDIASQQSIAPYEIRQELKAMGVAPGISKKKVNVYDIEEKLIKYNDNIMWVKVRIDGSKLKISTVERTAPPKIEEDNSPCDIVSNKDGQVVRVFTSSGTPMVKVDDIVKPGQLLVKGEQGKEGNAYAVHAKGCIIARTFYERQKEINLEPIKKEKSGRKIENYYMIIKNKKVYIKNNLIKFDNYDKIEDNRFFIKKETYYEMVEKKVKIEKQKCIDESIKELYSNISMNLGEDVVIVDKKVDVIPKNNNYLVRLVLIVEEDIGIPQKINDKDF